MMQEKQVGIPDSTCLREEKKNKTVLLERVQAGNGKKGRKKRLPYWLLLFLPTRPRVSGFLKWRSQPSQEPLSFVIPTVASSPCPFRSRDSESCTITNCNSFDIFFGSLPFSPQLGIESHWKQTLWLNVIWICHLFLVEIQTNIAFQIMLLSKSTIMPLFFKQHMLFHNSVPIYSMLLLSGRLSHYFPLRNILSNFSRQLFWSHHWQN